MTWVRDLYSHKNIKILKMIFKEGLKMKANKILLIVSLSFFLILLSSISWSHCDTLDGPVVKAAQKALDTGDVNLILIWVQKDDEVEIKKAFEKTLTVRKLTREAKDLADMYFFETLVRIHRAGEGAPYTGLKPAGTVDSLIEMADKAVETGDAGPLTDKVLDAVKEGISGTFNELKEKKNYKTSDVSEGREYVRSYVTFVHYVEGIYNSANIKDIHHAHNEEQKESSPQVEKHTQHE